MNRAPKRLIDAMLTRSSRIVSGLGTIFILRSATTSRRTALPEDEARAVTASRTPERTPLPPEPEWQAIAASVWP